MPADHVLLLDSNIIIEAVRTGCWNALTDAAAQESLVRTLGKALVVGAQELLEIEPDEIAFMAHRDGPAGWSIALYERLPGELAICPSSQHGCRRGHLPRTAGCLVIRATEPAIGVLKELSQPI